MEPAFIVWSDGGGTNQPHAGFLLLDQNPAAGELLAKRDLTVGPDNFDARSLGSAAGHRIHRLEHAAR